MSAIIPGVGDETTTSAARAEVSQTVEELSRKIEELREQLAKANFKDDELTMPGDFEGVKPQPLTIIAPPVVQHQPAFGSYNDNGGWGGGPYSPVVDNDTKCSTKFGHVYSVAEEIWNENINNWVPFHAPPPVDYGGAIFVVHHRRTKRTWGRFSSRKEEVDCFTVVDILNVKLVEVIRPVCKNVEELFNRSPQFNLSRLYPYIDALVEYADELEQAQFDKDVVSMLRSFLEFAQEEYAPLKEKFHALLSEGKITSEFLWAIFKPGVRVRSVHFPGQEIIGAIVDSTAAVGSLGAAFSVNGRTLAWNGSQYEYYTFQYMIPYLWEPCNLADLPITILNDADFDMLTERGRKYTEFTGVKHVHVKGIFSGVAKDMTVDTRVMLDTETYRSGRVPQRGGSFGVPYQPPVQAAPYVPGVPMNQAAMDPWGNPAQPGWGVPQQQQQQPYYSPPPPPKRSKKRRNQAPPGVIAPTFSNDEDENEYLPMDEVPVDLMWLLPPVLMGYNFSNKSWGEFKVVDIQPIVYDEKVWDRLVLDADIKTIIRSIVDARGKPHGARMINDWIKGKGGGLVVLLHGVAGVGKTLTAEAVAELLHRPLYTVGSGELGYAASDVEPTLKMHLELASTWNAVLLIDEADVFLEKRSTSDLMRNALVATFLRLLEYHSGMLFLTTNRVKAFDEAFLSRISVAIQYHELDIVQRSQIWWQFLNFVLEQKTEGESMDVDPALFTEECLKELAMKPFNGRIIKNIVRTAQALAISSEEPLGMGHIRTVTGITEKFLRDTDAVRNEDGNRTEGLDPINEVVSIA